MPSLCSQNNYLEINFVNNLLKDSTVVIAPCIASSIKPSQANTQYVARWDKSGKRKKSGRPPTFFTVPSPVKPPLGLIFDILIFSYQKLIYKLQKNGISNTRRQRVYKIKAC